MTIHHPTLFIFILTGETTTRLQASLGKKKKKKKEKKDVSTILFSGCARLYKLYACILDKKKKKLIEREKQKVTREMRIEKTKEEKKNIRKKNEKKKKLCSE